MDNVPIKLKNFMAPKADRGGNVYLMGVDLMGPESTPVFTHIISRTRQWEKSTGLKGRQLKKWRKQSRLNVREMLREAKVGNG